MTPSFTTRAFLIKVVGIRPQVLLNELEKEKYTDGNHQGDIYDRSWALFFGAIITDTGDLKLRAENSEAFLPGIRTYTGDNLWFNGYFTDLSALRTNQKLRNTVLMIALDMRTGDVLIKYIELMSEMFSLKEIQNTINRHRLHILSKMIIAVIGQFVSGKGLVRMQQRTQNQFPFSSELFASS
ncbi:hypothetical protein VspSTUT11_08610 [Vibrio sp. STUT-A11]|nr:hypothetical protein VspSTUT11_08610 [Vibrio sp. STUT-A11]